MVQSTNSGIRTKKEANKLTRHNLQEKQKDNAQPGFNIHLKFRGHDETILCISWSPDGRILASASEDKTIRLWDVNKGSLLNTLKGHTDIIRSLAWSPDGRMLASASDDTTIQLWDAKSGKPLRMLKGHTSEITCVAWSPDGSALASSSSDETIEIWDSKTGEPIRLFAGPKGPIYHIVWSPDGKMLASSSGDSIRLWNVKNGELLRLFSGHVGSVYCVAWSPDGKTLASASNDTTIRIWDPKTGRQKGILEAHTDGVNCISFSSDGLLFASKSFDRTYRLWRCDTWDTIAVIDKLPLGPLHPRVLAFHPKENYMATIGENSTDVCLWCIDYELLLGTNPFAKSVRYTTAKIALVGDSGVGKTGLGWRLAYGEFKNHSSTHGQQFWLINELQATLSDGTNCEAVLWDFAGQPDYRLIHSLFMDDIDLALVMFDPANRQEPLKGVEYWLNQLSHCKGGPCNMILIGARMDRGTPTLTQHELNDFCRNHNIKGGYVSTSALRGDGLIDLMNRMKSQINWDQMTATITTVTFKRIKKYVLTLKEEIEKKIFLLSPIELRARLESTYPGWSFSDEEMITAVGHLENHGYVNVLRGSSGNQSILMTPDILKNLASSFVLEARQNPKGLGSLEEALVLNGEYNFPEIEDMHESEKEILLDAVTVLFLEHHICFRESLGTKTFLVFPALINQKKPIIEDVEIVEDISYTVSGAVENVYAALVVLLGYTNTFTRTNQWQNNAQYEMDEGEICGFKQISEREGEIFLVLYYWKKVPKHTRLLFQGLFEKFLAGREVTVTKYPPVVCTLCGYIQERNQVVRRIKETKFFLFCGDCGNRILLEKPDYKVDLSPHDHKKLDNQQEMAKWRTKFEAALTLVKGYIRNKSDTKAISCFISYAWGEFEHERWVAKLAKDLQNAGIEVILDQRDNAAIGSNVSRFISLIEKSNYIIVVGTPLYKEKYENKVSKTGSIVAAEVDLINVRLIGTEQEKQTILPLLLYGDEKNSLPPLMRGRVYGNFRKEATYFGSLFDLILTLCNIPFDEPAVIDLRLSMRGDEMRKI